MLAHSIGAAGGAERGGVHIQDRRLCKRPEDCRGAQRREEAARGAVAQRCASSSLTLEQLRHPSVLQFKDAHEVETDKGLVTLHLVTEPVQPLSVLLAELRQEGGEWCARQPRLCVRLTRSRNDYFASGLSQIATAVAFLNVDGKKVRARNAPTHSLTPSRAGARQRLPRLRGGHRHA